MEREFGPNLHVSCFELNYYIHVCSLHMYKEEMERRFDFSDHKSFPFFKWGNLHIHSDIPILNVHLQDQVCLTLEVVAVTRPYRR